MAAFRESTQVDRYSVILGDGGGNRKCVPTGLSGVGGLLLGPVYKERGLPLC